MQKKRKDMPGFEQPLTLVDVVIFAVIGERLQLLLVRRALAAGGNASDARWFPIVHVGVGEELAFDHAGILEAAVRRLRSKVEYTSLPAFLLPREFTLTELQRAYETVLGRPLEKSAFRTRMLAANLVVETGKTRTAASRPAQVYRLRSATKPVLFPRTFDPR
jgi:8-oxo-dGTP diphosphatase